MKKLLTALILSALMLSLSGCGAFRSHHAWKKAEQEKPLEIPPGMSRPATTDALSIPPPSQADSSDGQAQEASAPAPTPATPVQEANATSMHLAEDVNSAYQRVGLALQQGDLGTVTAQDPASHTYQLSIASKASLGDSQGGFLKKHFSNLQDSSDADGQAAAVGGQGDTGAKVTLTVSEGADGGSDVHAGGNQEQAARIISALNSRLGG